MWFIPLIALLLPLAAQSAERLELIDAGYFSKPGLDVIVFSDIYPDGRGNHNNGWNIVRCTVPSGATEGAVEWVIQVSQLEKGSG